MVHVEVINEDYCEECYKPVPHRNNATYFAVVYKALTEDRNPERALQEFCSNDNDFGHITLAPPCHLFPTGRCKGQEQLVKLINEGVLDTSLPQFREFKPGVADKDKAQQAYQLIQEMTADSYIPEPYSQSQ